MHLPNLHSATELESYLDKQKRHAWSLEGDIPWKQGIDLRRPFLALDEKRFSSLAPEQLLVFSQFLGLIVNSSIAELEKALVRNRESCWERPLRRHPVNPEMWELGENFFAEEKKHADAFDRYLELFAREVNVTGDELRSFLPSFDNSRIEKLIQLDGGLGGHAMWWVVAAVEEESILIFQLLRKAKEKIDPLYYQIHRYHFEEEVRHAAYAFLMLKLLRKRARFGPERLLKAISFIVSDVLQVCWTFSQLYKGRKFLDFSGRSDFFRILSGLIPLLGNQSPLKLIHSLFTDAPYLSLFLNPASQEEVSKLLAREEIFHLRRPAAG